MNFTATLDDLVQMPTKAKKMKRAMILPIGRDLHFCVHNHVTNWAKVPNKNARHQLDLLSGALSWSLVIKDGSHLCDDESPPHPQL